MVIGALTAIVHRATDATRFFFIIVLLVVVFRELAVTSLRLVASSSGGKVVAANMLGKIKTVCQIVFVVVAIVEPIVYGYVALPDAWETNVPLSYVFGGLTVILTVWSGINYFVGLWKYLDPEK
jgi:phosphatidylglycerophosphate synthase